MKNYQKLKEVIQSASRKQWYNPNACPVKYEPIRLADVLLAVQKVDLPSGYLFFNVNYRGNIEMAGLNGRVFYKWNLEDNDLDNQSTETKQFLIDLLIKK